MGLTTLSQEQFKRLSSNTNEFGIAITLTAPDDTVLVVNGFETLHHTSYTAEGDLADTKISSVSFSLGFLEDVSYPFIVNSEADFNEHKVTVQGKDYIVSKFYPDLKLNMVVLILGEWQA